MHLVNQLKNKNHTIYFDRFFSGVQLFIDLFKMDIFACGTVMANRKNMPNIINNLKLKAPHEIICIQCKNLPNLLCTTWLDKKTDSRVINKREK